MKRSWPLLVGGAVCVFAISAGLFHLAISGKMRRDATASMPIAEEIATSTEASLLVPRKLDGVSVSPDQVALQSYAVMVENAPDARPLMGPAKANLAIEAPVEGGFTRLLLVFDATSTVDQIGPVRSARPYYVDWAEGLQSVYAHVGGSPESLQNISSLGPVLRNLDEFSSGRYFWRSSKRLMPHNVFTRMDLLRAAHDAKAWGDGTFRPWRYLSTTTTEHGDVIEFRVPYGGTFTATWNYDTETSRYVRSQSGAVQKDGDGMVVTASNVVVLLTEEEVLDDIGRLRVRTTGNGKAVLYRNGKKFDVTWRRKAGEWISFETVEGSDVEFEPGTTWISVVTSPKMLQ